jgi:hypothetical protein
MFHELIHMLPEGPDDPIAILVMVSLFRDDMPWLYEIGREVYESVKRGDRKSAEKAMDRFRHAVHMARRGPFMEESGVHPEMIMEIDHLLHGFLARTGRVRLKKKGEPESGLQSQGS